MSKQVGTYKNADVYVNDRSKNLDLKHKLLRYEVWAEGIHPVTNNLKTDFLAENRNQDVALRKVYEQIDDFLDKHEVEKFKPKSHS